MSGFGGCFSFDKAGGGGGGKVSRVPFAVEEPYGQNMKFHFPGEAVTSPERSLDSPMYLRTNIGDAFTYTSLNTGALTASVTVNVGNTYWIDMLWVGIDRFRGNDYDGNIFSTLNISVEGNTVGPVPVRGPFGPAQIGLYLDVYGYGLQATVKSIQTATDTRTLYAGPLVARTIISESGGVVWPPGLKGQQVARDI